MKVRVRVFVLMDDYQTCIDDMEVFVTLMDYHVASCITQFGTTCRIQIDGIEE